MSGVLNGCMQRFMTYNGKTKNLNPPEIFTSAKVVRMGAAALLLVD